MPFVGLGLFKHPIRLIIKLHIEYILLDLPESEELFLTASGTFHGVKMWTTVKKQSWLV